MLSFATMSVCCHPQQFASSQIVLSEGSKHARSRGSSLKHQPTVGRKRKAKVDPSPLTNEMENLDLAELKGHLGYFLRRLQVWVFRDFINTLSSINLRPAQYSVLILIAANPGQSQAAIGKTLNIERAGLARLLHELERRKWIQRLRGPKDGRSHALFLTSEGEKTLERIKKLALRHEAQLAQFVGPERRKLLLEVLIKLV
jgi:DNA-binding MarR family transcriptional regulator